MKSRFIKTTLKEFLNENLAPNSNLTIEQSKLVRTPEFKAWFGDWENDPENSSKVVDENGEPLVIYHGTNSEIFDEFMPSAIDYYNGKPERIFKGNMSDDEFINYIEKYGLRKMDNAFWFSHDKTWGVKHIPCFLRIINIKYAKSIDIKQINGYDGICVHNDDGNDFYCVNQPNNIKSADGSNIKFDITNNNIKK